MNNVIKIGDIEVTIRRSEKRRTLGLTVERDGSVVALVPALAKEVDVIRHIRSRELWMHNALGKREAHTDTPPTKSFVTGEGFYYLGRSYRLRVVKLPGIGDKTLPLRLHQSRFLLRQDAKSIARQHFINWYAAAGQRWLAGRLPELAKRVGVIVVGSRVKDLGYRWASCSKNGWLNFHWKTLQLPPPIITYLILHELCHLVEHNHGPRFWQRLRTVAHDYETAERWLRENGTRYGF